MHRSEKDTNEAPIKPLDWRDRPAKLKQHIFNAWKKLSAKSASTWTAYNGDPEEPYYLCQVNEYQLIKALILKNPEKKICYVLDIGAGNFGFGRGLAKFLNNSIEIPNDIQIHIIGIRAEKTTQPEKIVDGICVLHELGNFQVENMYDEFNRCNINLTNKVDVIVTSNCFRHLIDPVGTFLQSYDLLKSETGLFLTDGNFDCRIDNKINNQNSEYLTADRLLAATNVPLHKGRNGGYALRKLDDNECRLPLSYNDVKSNGEETGVNASSLVTTFKILNKFENNSPTQLFTTDSIDQQVEKEKKSFKSVTLLSVADILINEIRHGTHRLKIKNGSQSMENEQLNFSMQPISQHLKRQLFHLSTRNTNIANAVTKIADQLAQEAITIPHAAQKNNHVYKMIIDRFDGAVSNIINKPAIAVNSICRDTNYERLWQLNSAASLAIKTKLILRNYTHPPGGWFLAGHWNRSRENIDFCTRILIPALDTVDINASPDELMKLLIVKLKDYSNPNMNSHGTFMNCILFILEKISMEKQSPSQKTEMMTSHSFSAPPQTNHPIRLFREGLNKHPSAYDALLKSHRLNFPNKSLTQ